MWRPSAQRSSAYRQRNSSVMTAKGWPGLSLVSCVSGLCHICRLDAVLPAHAEKWMGTQYTYVDLEALVGRERTG
jgi:hypothetical protein